MGAPDDSARGYQSDVLSLVLAVTCLTAQADSTRLITSDIPNFWRAYDLAAGKDSTERVRAFQTAYLQPGSPGLRNFMWIRISNRDTVRARMIAAGWTAARMDSLGRLPRGTPGRDSLNRAMEPLVEHNAAEELVKWIGRYPRYYAAIRARTLSVDTSTQVTSDIRRGLSRLTELYPDAKFPDVYFLIGTTSTGGTTGWSGMMIGTEQYGSDSTTPRDELPAWALATFRTLTFATLPGLVIHEAVHTQQKPRPDGEKNTLLRQSLGEGIADFLAELAVGPYLTTSPRQLYGRAHEREVWLDFQDEMATDSTIMTWMYNGRMSADSNHGAMDMGYFVGYRIAQAYYNRATDKRTAVRELLELRNPHELLAKSGYKP